MILYWDNDGLSKSGIISITYNTALLTVITFRVRRSRGEMYIGHGRLCICLSIPRRIPTLLHGPRCKLGNGRACPIVVHYWTDLQSVHGFRCYDVT